MERENRVSVWTGKFNDKESLVKYLKESYDNDGDMTSTFMEEFKIEFYDVDLSEFLFIENNDLSQLRGFSYSDSFIKNVVEKVLDQNSFLVIYDFDYDLKNTYADKLKFIGSFDYFKD